jgi:hypothetical protein
MVAQKGHLITALRKLSGGSKYQEGGSKMTERCKKCGQEFKDGELVLEENWDGTGGQHADCPTSTDEGGNNAN